ncbi:MAG: hypothetical protein EPO08_15760 [Rhodospirillaceae bacterium]|nr:MAG: hypothetical protein EPO08_15760 [Rhodospirillaceae bacterium]
MALPKRCAQDVHDDYTPLWLDPTGKETERDAAFGYGWHGISESLKAGIQVVNWNDAARRWKHYCYAYYGNPGEWQRALGDVLAATHTSDSGLRQTTDFLKQAARSAMPDNRISLLGNNDAIDIPAVRFKRGLDCLFAPAQGFSANQVLEAVGFHDETKVVFYDGNKAALAFRRHMIDTWDGENFAAFIIDARRAIAAAHPNAAFALPEGLAEADRAERPIYRGLGLSFESKESWLRHWRNFRKLRHEFVNLDPLRQPTAVAECIQSHAAAFTIAAIDNCFDSLDGLMLFDWTRRKFAHDVLVQSLKSNSQVYLVVGTPPRRRIRG